MSKAFTSEETEDVSIPGRVPTRPPVGEERPIREEGLRALVARHDALLAERAAAALDAQKELDHEIALASAAIDSVRVVPVPPPDGVVRFGSVVTLRWDDGRMQTVTLVGPDEAQGDAISIASPLGRALVGARLDAVLEIDRPRGAAEATVVAIA